MSETVNSSQNSSIRNREYAVWQRLGITLWCALGVFSLLLATLSPEDIPGLSIVLAPLQAHISTEKAMYSPLAYFCLFSVVYFLEGRVPVRTQQRFSRDLIQDALWYVLTMVFRITLLAAYLNLLVYFYEQHLHWMTIEAATQWHPVTRFLVAVLVTDFFRWFAHLLLHKVPAFWAFHSLHHSQREMNIFTDARVHPMERVIAGSIKFLPAMMLANSLPVILAWAVFQTIYPKFYHANVRLDFGFLRYVLVTPQSHRVHHGKERRYQDKNFGFTFSIWDWLFQTQYRDHAVYPETGIEDDAFPAQSGRTPGAMLLALWRQFLYPFRALGRS